MLNGVDPYDGYQEYTIEEIKRDGNSWECRYDDMWWIHFDTDLPIDPQVGDSLKIWGPKFGARRGLAINETVINYRTEEEERLYREEQQRIETEAQKKKATDVSPETNMRISRLPQLFRERINAFARNNKDFWWEYLSYELMVCEDAVKIDKHFNTLEEIEEWAQLPYDKQNDMLALTPGHSGNSFGMAVRLGYFYKKDPTSVLKEHGALCPLVGCIKYGCVHGGEE